MGSFQYTPFEGGLIGYLGHVHIGSLADWPDFSIEKMNVCIVFSKIGSPGGRRIFRVG